MAQERPSLRRAVVALQYANFRLFYLALVVAGVGAQIQTTANIWQIAEMTGSPLLVGLTGLARAIPVIGLSLIGGTSRTGSIGAASSCSARRCQVSSLWR